MLLYLFVQFSITYLPYNPQPFYTLIRKLTFRQLSRHNYLANILKGHEKETRWKIKNNIFGHANEFAFWYMSKMQAYFITTNHWVLMLSWKIVQVMKDSQLFLVVGILLTIDIIIMTTWQVFDPFFRFTQDLKAFVSSIFILAQND